MIIAYDDRGDRVSRFCETVGRSAQTSILFGRHFSDLRKLAEHCLPKPAIDPISSTRAELLKNRGVDPAVPPEEPPKSQPEEA